MFLNLFCVVDSFCFPENMNLDLTGIGHLRLDLLGDISRQEDHLVFTDFLRFYHNPDFTASLDGIGACYTGEASGNLFQLFKTLDVVFNILTPCAGTGSGNGICSLYTCPCSPDSHALCADA